ncbi:MAG TPA: hemerythrin domain-containing protein [Oligoflexus sp.]|uniref:hemerythrin domain-containing protein n=1 Tax=Oligoflexus sp. TaxID=1971216 RepID=UPI002D7E72BA|nr:hemerythrin domain-containing protein [Oligoflexus sp.]HET9241039.1 hemerythrin domain-containing protein [Oligoflexus sp.]
MQHSEESLREALGYELSDMMYRQKALALCNERVGFWDQHFRSMADDDQKNVELLETVMASFGVRVSPRRSTEQIADLLIDVVVGETSRPLEKLGAYTLLKKSQLMSVQLVSKATQHVLPDIRMTLEPLDGLGAILNNHVSQLKTFIEHKGVAWLTGHEVPEGLFERAREAVADITDRVIHRAAGTDEREIFPVLQMDHRKVELLFKEIEESKTHEKALGIFRQLKADLNAHSIAEEETVYMRFQSVAAMREYLTEARQDHADIRVLLEEATELQDEHEAFLDKIDELHQLVVQHVEEEENQLFKMIRKNSSEELRRDLTQNFLKAKQRIQENLGPDSTSPQSGQEPQASL